MAVTEKSHKGRHKSSHNIAGGRRMEFAELVKIEPRLGILLDKAKLVSSRGQPNFCANRVWYGRWLEDGWQDGLKSELVKLVGWHAERDDKTIRSPKAYDIAYETIYNALPNCRHGGCFC